MLSLNIQPVEKQTQREDGSLEVVGIWRTIQGEGPFAGTPAVFIRLAGCNLQCPLCDTNYTTGREFQTPLEVLHQVSLAKGPRRIRLLVLTGGEPFRQGLGPFFQETAAQGYCIQVETNGTLFDEEAILPLEDISIVCSPKTPRINEELLPYINAYKYVLSADAVDCNDGLPTSALGMTAPPARPHLWFQGDVFVQPLDEQDPDKNKRHLKAALDSCMRFGYRLSLQQHKLLGLE